MSLMLKILFRLYQWTVSPFLHVICGPGCGCRYEPSCSNYAIQAIDVHGAGRGSWLAVKRIFRCHPWGGFGFDPVPPRAFSMEPFHSTIAAAGSGRGFPPIENRTSEIENLKNGS